MKSWSVGDSVLRPFRLSLVLLMVISVYPFAYDLYWSAAKTHYFPHDSPVVLGLGVLRVLLCACAMAAALVPIITWRRSHPNGEKPGAARVLVAVAVLVASAYVLAIPFLAERTLASFLRQV